MPSVFVVALSYRYPRVDSVIRSMLQPPTLSPRRGWFVSGDMDGEGGEGAHNGVRSDDVVEVRVPKRASKGIITAHGRLIP